MMNKGIAASIGTFDGVHRGHALVIETLRDVAAEKGLLPMVFTFDRHPLETVAPERAPGMICDAATRHRLLSDMRVAEEVVAFTPEVRHLTARQWMERLRDSYGVRLLVVGYDNTFGSDGRMLSHDQLRSIGSELGISVVEAPRLPGCSSSAVRKAVAEGNVGEAAAILGRPYSLEGKVGHGREIGRTIGFPTANVVPDGRRLVPGGGVYAAEAVLPDGHRWPAMVNIGCRPTIGEGLSPTIEAHLIGYSGDLYGQHLTLRFLRRLRGEQKFASLSRLKSRLESDREEALRVLSSAAPLPPAPEETT